MTTLKGSTIRLISKKAILHVQHTFFVHFFAVVLHDYNVKLQKLLSYTEWRKCHTCSCSLFFAAPHVHLAFDCWPTAFLILSPPLQNFHVVLPPQNFLSVTLDPCRPFSRWALLACHLIFLALYSKFVDMTINLSLIL